MKVDRKITSGQPVENLEPVVKARRNRGAAPTAPRPKASSVVTAHSETASTANSIPVQDERKVRWRWGFLAALGMALLSFYPQLDLWLTRGPNSQGAFAFTAYDEEIYAAYVNNLYLGRPRRLDPLARLEAGKPASESLFSIQFVPPYLIALTARALGATTAQAFIWLAPITAFLSTLALFYLLTLVTRDAGLASAGALGILCFGTLVAGDGVLFKWLSASFQVGYFPFLRRYQPGAAFPFWFLLLAFIWQALMRNGRTAWYAAIGAGLVFVLLVFSYFYLWTAAAAWLACFALAWLITRRDEWRWLIWRLAPTAIFGVTALALYAALLAQRGSSLDRVQILTTHTPDFYRATELIGILIIPGLIWGVRKERAQRHDPMVLLALSLALTPIIVFNQQVITGRSLQPFHYANFIANYAALLALFLAIICLWRGGVIQILRQVPRWAVAVLACVALGWGAWETQTTAQTRREMSVTRDLAVSVAKRLASLAAEKGRNPLDRELVLSDVSMVTEVISIYGPQTVLWNTHLPFAGGLSPKEQEERFFQSCYYAGKNAGELESELVNYNFIAITALFGYERYFPLLTNDFKLVSRDEIREKVRLYADYIATFNRQRAAHAPLSYVVTTTATPMNLSNLDRWYQRDAGERIGPFTLYQVKLW